MVLAMSRPWKHPKTGMYWVRRRVPNHLIDIVGKSEEKLSLGTKDPAEAKRRFAVAMTDIETRWDNLASPSRSLSEVDANELAQVVYTDYVLRHSDNPSEQTFWDSVVGNMPWDPLVGKNCFVTVSIDERPKILDFSRWDQKDFLRSQYERWCEEAAAHLLKTKGLPETELNRSRLAMSVARAMQAASLALADIATGNFGLVPKTSQYSSPKILVGQPVSFNDLIVGWAGERKPSAKTRYTVERLLLQLAGFVGHADAALLTPEKLLEWKASLLAAGLSARTIKATKFGLLKPVLQWGVDNKKIASNPAEKITVSINRNAGGGRRSFTDVEAQKVLDAASTEHRPFLRWIPLLCAYSGARISEVCQLRKEDLIEVGGIWCLKFAPEAGSLKNANSERLVPLHDNVMAAGFLVFTGNKRPGPLFDDLTPDRFGNRGGRGTKLIGSWVRDLGIDDPRISPSHSWRHRFKTLGRRHGLALDVVNAMTGHGRKDVASTYGEYEPIVMHRELMKLP